jgi:hypothetical protein
MTVPGGRGIHRFSWNLRGAPATLPPAGGGPGGGGGGGGFGGGGGQGAFVPPGTYRLALSRRSGGTVTALGEPQTITVTADPGLSITPAMRTTSLEYQDRVNRLQRSYQAAQEQADDVKARTAAIRRAVVDSSADLKLLDQAGALDRRALLLQRSLRGDETIRGDESGSASTIQSRVNSAVAGARGLSGMPTGTQQQNYTIASEDLATVIKQLQALETELSKFESQLDAAGVPHTPRRRPQG